MITYCDVIPNCTDCPRYGDDCDGDKRVEHADLIRRADAIEAVASITMSIHLSDVICDKLMALPSADAEQVTSKLNNPCDSLLTDDSDECKEQKSKLEHDREWIIGCIKHDGFIKTDRFDKANQIILDALSAEAEWIPVSKALPSKGQVVLAIGDKGTWDVGQFKGTAEWTDDERMWWWKNKSIKRVEYWMPKDAIPLPYREDGEA